MDFCFVQFLGDGVVDVVVIGEQCLFICWLKILCFGGELKVDVVQYIVLQVVICQFVDYIDGVELVGVWCEVVDQCGGVLFMWYCYQYVGYVLLVVQGVEVGGYCVWDDIYWDYNVVYVLFGKVVVEVIW